jgi:hypothetical protein
MRALAVAIVVSSMGGVVCAEPADQDVKRLEACFQTARETDPVCSNPASDPAQRRDCFERTRAALLQCMEQATPGVSVDSAAPDLPTGKVSPETSAGTSPADRPDNPAPSRMPVGAAPPERPASVFDVPARQVDVPAKQPDVPAKQADAPVKQAIVPAKQPEVPAKQADAPVKQAIVPAKRPEVPAKQADAPVQQAIVPAKPAEVPANPIDTPAKPGDTGWVVSETTSPVDFSPLITAVIHTTSGTGTLSIRCHGLRTDLSVHSEGAWRSTRSGDIQVAYQIDRQPSVKLAWAESTDGKTANYKQDAADLLRSLPEGARLKISVFDNAGLGHDAFFQLTGLDSIRKKFGTVCKSTPENRISSGKP